MYIASNSDASLERRWFRRLLLIEAMTILLAAARNWRLLLRIFICSQRGQTCAQYLGARPEVWEMPLIPLDVAHDSGMISPTVPI
jgi:hypothetical protein